MEINLLEKFEIPNRIKISSGDGGLPKIVATTKFSVAEIYLHGTHVTHFQKNGEPPLLFMSAKSLFAAGKAIRGGVPICFPWFGARENFPAHGFARLAEWELTATNILPDGGARIHLCLPEKIARENNFMGKVDFIVIANETLTMELKVENVSDAQLEFEECLHSYFLVGDIGAISVRGLRGKNYLDKVAGGSQKTETADAIRFDAEVDRVYLNSAEAIEIFDEKLRRSILVEKSNSSSTVVWNPWIAKAKVMADFGDEEFRKMVCVEAGNVGPNKISLAPGKISALKVELSNTPQK